MLRVTQTPTVRPTGVALENVPPAVEARPVALPFPSSVAGSSAGVAARLRPAVSGKFLSVGNQKFYARGATYGGFRPDADDKEYTDLEQVRRDFEQMAASGFNAVRIPHTLPPVELLDIACEHGLKVMVGLSAEQYVGYLIDRAGAPDIEALIAEKVETCAGHPGVLCYALGNEIPASVARWLGRRRIERYLERLYRVVKGVDPDGLVTYVNYPSTEYLQLPFLDLLSFNVYLEARDRLENYLGRLQNLAGDRPLLMTELGLDGLRHGTEAQADAIDWQIRTTFAAGCTGAFVFSWTDEWYRGGAEVDDWAFGLTDRNRNPKLALMAAQWAFAEVPFVPDLDSPSMSVVVCVYNGERSLRDCCEGLRQLDYPHFEIIIVDDGSTDSTAAIAAEYGFRLIRTENRGLSHARNTGLAAATGEIVAYTDADARPDPHWLTYLAETFRRSSHAGVGGWNIAPSGDGWVAACVANAPGRPIHVLLSDHEAEHIPGVCMAFRRDALERIGGFDPQFRAAGDDVDICWRLQEEGMTLGFAHGAFVWHHHRDSVRDYWKQQRGYGHAEALLERKWPHKYNSPGHLTWGGRLYGKGLTLPLGRVSRIYHGLWGSAPFQSLVELPPGVLRSLPLMPEWYLLVASLGGLSLLGLVWRPLLLLSVPLLVACIALLVFQASASAARGSFASDARSIGARLRRHIGTTFLHLLQPLARLRGRFGQGLTPWRQRGRVGWVVPWVRKVARWTRQWQAPDERLHAIEAALGARGVVVHYGGSYDRWDLEARTGLLGRARLLMAVEDTGVGHPTSLRTRVWPRCSMLVVFGALASSLLAVGAALDGSYFIAGIMGALAGLLCFRSLDECAAAGHAIDCALEACGVPASGQTDTEVSDVDSGHALDADESP